VLNVGKKDGSGSRQRRHGLTLFLKKHVKAVGLEQKSKWMQLLSSPKHSLSDLVEEFDFGVPLHGHKALGERSPLLEQLTEHQPPLARGTWYVKVVCLNSEINQQGVKAEMRARNWTLQLVDYLASRIRVPEVSGAGGGGGGCGGGGCGCGGCGGSQGKKRERAALPDAQPSPSLAAGAGTSHSTGGAPGGGCAAPQDERSKWQYVKRLARWQFEEGLLAPDILLDGLLSLLQDMQVRVTRRTAARHAGESRARSPLRRS
jgi:hypothetical protein